MLKRLSQHLQSDWPPVEWPQWTDTLDSRAYRDLHICNTHKCLYILDGKAEWFLWFVKSFSLEVVVVKAGITNDYYYYLRTEEILYESDKWNNNAKMTTLSEGNKRQQVTLLWDVWTVELNDERNGEGEGMENLFHNLGKEWLESRIKCINLFHNSFRRWIQNLMHH